VSQFSRYLLGAVGSLDRDKNARPGVIKLIKEDIFRAFFARFTTEAGERATQYRSVLSASFVFFV
jgi:hypothetical protein